MRKTGERHVKKDLYIGKIVLQINVFIAFLTFTANT